MPPRVHLPLLGSPPKIPANSSASASPSSYLVEEGAVVDAEGRGDAFGEAVPVFGVVGAGPFVDGGHASLHLWRGGVSC